MIFFFCCFLKIALNVILITTFYTVNLSLHSCYDRWRFNLTFHCFFFLLLFIIITLNNIFVFLFIIYRWCFLIPSFVIWRLARIFFPITSSSSLLPTKFCWLSFYTVIVYIMYIPYCNHNYYICVLCIGWFRKLKGNKQHLHYYFCINSISGKVVGYYDSFSIAPLFITPGLHKILYLNNLSNQLIKIMIRFNKLHIWTLSLFFFFNFSCCGNKYGFLTIDLICSSSFWF